MADFSNIQTLEDYIEYGYNSDYGFNKLTTLKNVEGYVLPDTLVYDKFRNLIFGQSYVIELNDDDYRKYRFRPDRVAYDLYSNPNLYHLILYLNNCSEAKFDLRRLRILGSSSIIELMKLIAIHESEDLDKNKKKVTG